LRKEKDGWILSPRDLIAELECDHRLNLEWSVATGLIDRPLDQIDEGLQLIMDKGVAHEDEIVANLSAKRSFVSIPKPEYGIESIKKALAETLDAVERGVEVIHQAALFTGDYIGYADFLVLARDESKEPLKDETGKFIYEPVDAKSARTAKRAAVLQVASYARAMVRLGMPTPPKVRLWLAGDAEWEAATADLIDLAEEFEARARSRIEGFTGTSDPNWAPPREACVRCRWQEHCAEGRVRDRDLSLIYGIRASTRLSLLDSGIKTIDQMSEGTEEQRKSIKKPVAQETFDRLRFQAQIQLKGEGIEPPIWDVYEPNQLSLLPPTDPADIWFDMEGDPFSNNGKGLEYMFGFAFYEDDELKFDTFEAESSVEEKEAFSKFITFAMERRRANPNMHIYHYAAYEQTALRRLAQRYGVHEADVDFLLKNNVLVDLLPIVRKSIRFSTDSISIKAIESIFYPNKRGGGVAAAMDSVVAFNLAYLDLINGKRAEFDRRVSEIRDYNEDDCRSLHALNLWLLEQAKEHEIVPSDNLQKDDEANDQPSAEEAALLDGVPIDPEDRTPLEHGFALLAASIKYHAREEKPAWWDLFDTAEKDKDELDNSESVVTFARVEAGSWIPGTGRAKDSRTLKILEANVGDLRHVFNKEEPINLLYDLEHEERMNIMGTTRSLKNSTIEEVHEDHVIVKEKCATNLPNWSEYPIAILPGSPIKADAIAAVISNHLAAKVLANRNINRDAFPLRAWSDILLRRFPRQRSKALPKTGDFIKDITNALLDSDDSYIAVQGPPGTGKTHVGARVIARLVLDHNWKIGVVSQSHSVIENLLNSVAKHSTDVPIGKAAKSGGAKPSYHQDKPGDWARTQQGGYVIGGTAWNFARDDFRGLNLDLIVVDEAGQFSLANTIASISSARTALLLGDPQQLPQVSQGSHPEPVNESALQHLLGDAKTMPDAMGYFLDTTYRLHPELALPVSRLQYEGRLHSHPKCANRNLDGIAPGLEIVQIEHTGNTVRSIEEGEEIVTRIKNLLGRDWSDVNDDGNPTTSRPLAQSDILVVTAYNAQVKFLKSLMKDNGWSGIRVGTFDKFQGQEAPVVFVSMSTSMAEDLPRGIEFLLSPNRLNVAVSRAQWACYLIRSTTLSFMQPGTPEGMVMLGKFVTLCKN
jgi:uncharacterized protein